MPKVSQIDEVPCQAEVRILEKITLKAIVFLSLLLYHFQCDSKIGSHFTQRFHVHDTALDDCAAS